MPAVTYLSDHEQREWSSIPNDKEADELLQELRKTTGEDWLVSVRRVKHNRTLLDILLGRVKGDTFDYQLYCNFAYEAQIINLVGDKGGTVFHSPTSSRECVLNFILGYLSATTRGK